MPDIDVLQMLQESKLATSDIAPQNFDIIAEHLEKEEMDAALQLIQEAFNEGNFDMRLIAYYFFNDFLKSGVKSFKDSFPVLMSLTKDHWEALRPSHRKEKQIESSFNWLFTHVINKLKYDDRLRKENKPSVWPVEVVQMSEEEFAKLQAVMAGFSEFIYQKWSHSSAKEKVNNLLKRVADLKPLIVPEVKKKIETPQEPEPVSEVVVKKEEPIAPSDRRDQIFFETAEMMNLIKKLKTFEKLAEKREFLKAALVSHDISQALAQFDPCFYFPKLFSNYFNLLARYSSAIAEHSQNQESLEWKALDRLYKIDLDQFSQW